MTETEKLQKATILAMMNDGVTSVEALGHGCRFVTGIDEPISTALNELVSDGWVEWHGGPVARLTDRLREIRQLT